MQADDKVIVTVAMNCGPHRGRDGAVSLANDAVTAKLRAPGILGMRLPGVF